MVRKLKYGFEIFSELSIFELILIIFLLGIFFIINLEPLIMLQVGWLVLVPLILLKFHRYHTNVSKSLISSFLFLLSTFFLMKNAYFPKTTLSIAMILIFAYEIIHTIFMHPKPILGLLGSFHRGDGIIFRMIVVGLLITTWTSFKLNITNLHQASFIISLAGGISGIMVFLSWLHIMGFKTWIFSGIPLNPAKLEGTFGNPIYASNFLSATIPFEIYLIASGDVLKGIFTMIPTILGLTVSFGNATLLSLFVAFIISLFMFLMGPVGMIYPFIFGIILAIFAMFPSRARNYVMNKVKRIIRYKTKTQVQESVDDISRVHTADARLLIWNEWVRIFKMNTGFLLKGVGIENIDSITLKYRSLKTFLFDPAKAIDRFHCMFMDILAEGGILYFILWLFTIAIAFYKSLPFPWMLLSLIVMITNLAFAFFDKTNYILFFYILGLISSVGNFALIPPEIMVILLIVAGVNFYIHFILHRGQYILKFEKAVGADRNTHYFRKELFSIASHYFPYHGEYFIKAIENYIASNPAVFENVYELSYRFSTLAGMEKHLRRSSTSNNLTVYYRVLVDMCINLFLKTHRHNYVKLAFDYVKKGLNENPYDINLRIALKNIIYILGNKPIAFKIVDRLFRQILKSNIHFAQAKAIFNEFKKLLLAMNLSSAVEKYKKQLFAKYWILDFEENVLEKIATLFNVSVSYVLEPTRDFRKELLKIGGGSPKFPIWQLNKSYILVDKPENINFDIVEQLVNDALKRHPNVHIIKINRKIIPRSGSYEEE